MPTPPSGRRPATTATRAVLSVLATALFLTACGGADATATDPEPAGVEAAEASSTEATPRTEETLSPEGGADPEPAATAADTEPAPTSQTPTEAGESAEADDGTAVASAPGLSPDGLCSALEASTAAADLGLTISSYDINDGSFGDPGCSPVTEDGGSLALSNPQPENYFDKEGQELFDDIRSTSELFIGGPGTALDGVGDAALLWDGRASGDGGGTALALIGQDVIVLTVAGEVTPPQVESAFRSIVDQLT